MPESTAHDNLPQATVVPRRRTRISVVWIIPLLAAVVAVGIAIQRIRSEGPTITIVFNAARGVEAGKTHVKYKEVNIGQVTAVQLSADHSKVEVTAKIAKSAGGLMVEDAKFWVVEPRVTLGGISGLGTLVSGNYIGFEVGNSTKEQRQFTGLEVPPIITGGQPGRQFVLKAQKLGSLGIGAPVYYRSLQAGQVTAYDLAGDGKAIEVKIFVNAPYDRYVNRGTRFWNASGVDVTVGASGVEVRTEALIALFAGGLAFDTPTVATAAEPAAADTVFTLYDDHATAMKQPESITSRYVLYFGESLRGLSVGAPVTFLGLPAGEVTDVGFDIDPATLTLRGRVEIVSYPERLIARVRGLPAAAGEDLAQSARQRAFFSRMVQQRGMRAQLRTGNILTGQLYVALDYFPDAPEAKIDWTQELPVMPVVASPLPDVEAKLTSIVAKLDALPYEAIGADLTAALGRLNGTLRDASTALNRIDADVTPELRATLEELRRVVATADGVLKDQVNATLEETRRTMATANAVLQNTDATLVGTDAPGQQELRDALREIARAARSVRLLGDYLERHPEALIWGKAKERP